MIKPVLQALGITTLTVTAVAPVHARSASFAVTVVPPVHGTLQHIPAAKERAAPPFQVRGANDRLVRHDDAQEFLDALFQAGRRAEYIQVGGAGHAFFETVLCDKTS